MTSNFDAVVVQTHNGQETLEALREKPDVALVTVNRKLDRDYSDGLEVVRLIKADEDVGRVPVMLVTNYEEHQESAIEAGCVRGFGKLALTESSTVELLQTYLGS
ncbi:MAG: response regulator [Planctomycetota bacterium]